MLDAVQPDRYLIDSQNRHVTSKTVVGGSGADVSTLKSAKPVAAKPVAATPVTVKPLAARPVPAKSAAAANKSAKPVQAKPVTAKTVYLTFDDGPSGLTGEVLDILNTYKIKGTFFVLGQQAERRPEIIGRIHEEGHAIGNHTYDHNYTELYHKFTAFWNQIKQTEEIIRLITGERPQLVRAPGGTAGKFDAAYFDLLEQGGYKVFDWNVDSGDSKRKGVPADEIVKMSTAPHQGNEAVVLLHDGAGHEETVKALPRIIKYYQKVGYRFDILTPEIKPVQFKVQIEPKKGQPGSVWIAEHVTVNAALFRQGNHLEVDMNGLAAIFRSGEYRMENGKLLVPLRSAVERLGGRVNWDASNRTAKVWLGGRSWTADPFMGTIQSGKSQARQVPEIGMTGHTTWIPLREVLQLSGHPLKAIVSKGNAYKIQTL
ncbi:polysaccharide deacetylase family protein [Paenibacillus lemnae]|uniref:Polysaccharide deacetylase family protein n=2 Tax=Paenibacillus lemnae TaxID=1330551 RepID=A0A848MD52_PAELE|nr:polysaccharide deacetylase family protein [Paenibacillus lemnae]